jgi:uncharacterized protein (DUF849 family)
MLQVCLNGPRTRREHPALPVSADDLAAAAAGAVAAGAVDVHLHPKGPDDRDLLTAGAVGAAVAAVRAAVPGVPAGVTTGIWEEPDGLLALIGLWTELPDHASVNWHLPGADEVAAALLARGVAVHAGIWTGTDGAPRFLASPLAGRVSRVLAEVMGPEPGLAERLVAVLDGTGPLLLHGEDEATWPVFRHARARGLDTRIGLEDTLVLPDGSPARDNAALVRAALADLPR